MRGICNQKIGALSLLATEKILFPPKPDIPMDEHTDIGMDISNYNKKTKKIYIKQD